MRLIAHRGLWTNREACNTLPAFQAAFQKNIGIETDLRSFNGELYLSHDPIRDRGQHALFKNLLNLAKGKPNLPLFLNVKEDGLLPALKQWSTELRSLSAIFFDMSVPELIQYARIFPPAMLCTRFSEFESNPSALELCDWIWIDGFYKDCEIATVEKLHREHGKKLAFVSPELHGRDQLPFWKTLKDSSWLPHDRSFLCTDLIETFEETCD